MVAFLVVLVATGWSYGSPVPAADRAIASGAAFSAVVLGQLGTAFACRSTRRSAWRMGWQGNRLLAGAVGIEVLVLLALLLISPAAHLLGMAPPSPLGLAVAATAVPMVLAVDTGMKATARRRGRGVAGGR